MSNKQQSQNKIAEVGLTDNGNLSADQERAEQQYSQMLEGVEQQAGVRLPDDVLIQIVQANSENMPDLQAREVVQKYRNAPAAQQPQMPVQQSVVPEIENPISQDQVLNIDSTVEESASPPGPMTMGSKYDGKHKKDHKQHLKGKGEKAEKANEIYHSIMREKGKDEPSSEEQASAAAIAWSQANKVMKKKAYFRGEEVTVLDSYRGMWGEELVRVSVNGHSLEIPREHIEVVSAEAIDPIHELHRFASLVSDDVETRAEIEANIQNLKTAKDITRRLITEGSLEENNLEELDNIHSSFENRIAQLERRLASDTTEEDKAYLADLPKFEIGHEISVSSFSREGSDWMSEVIEEMQTEAEGIDIEKLAYEDPIVLVSSLSQDIIGDAVAVKNLALERVNKIAGPLEEGLRRQVVSAYVESTENARRRALANVKDVARQDIEEQQKIANSIPDEGMFL